MSLAQQLAGIRKRTRAMASGDELPPMPPTPTRLATPHGRALVGRPRTGTLILRRKGWTARVTDAKRERMKTKPWATTADLLAEIKAAHQRLIDGEVDVDQAHAEARQLGVAAKVIDIEIQHARLTGRLRQGDDTLPPIKLSKS